MEGRILLGSQQAGEGGQEGGWAGVAAHKEEAVARMRAALERQQAGEAAKAQRIADLEGFAASASQKYGSMRVCLSPTSAMYPSLIKLLGSQGSAPIVW